MTGRASQSSGIVSPLTTSLVISFVNAENDQSQNTHAMRLFLSAIRAANADLTAKSQRWWAPLRTNKAPAGSKADAG